MKVATSYFYKIRFFTPNMIPISTAVWDPQWFHKNKGDHYKFIDKNGVINGLRYPNFIFRDYIGKETECKGKDNCKWNPDNCEFLKDYESFISRTDFEELKKTLEELGDSWRKKTGITDELTFVFIVYETPSNPCSERKTIQNYFKRYGVDCPEIE